MHVSNMAASVMDFNAHDKRRQQRPRFLRARDVLGGSSGHTPTGFAAPAACCFPILMWMPVFVPAGLAERLDFS